MLRAEECFHEDTGQFQKMPEAMSYGAMQLLLMQLLLMQLYFMQ